MVKKTYKANRGLSSYIILFIGFGIIIVSVVVPVVLLPKNEISKFVPLLFPIILGLFFSFILVGSSIKFMTKYSFTNESLIIEQPLQKKEIIKWNEIADLILLDSTMSREILDKSTRDQFQLRDNLDISEFIKMLKDKSPRYKYFTMITRASVITTGKTGRLISLNIKNKEEMIHLILKNGSDYYLTPNDPGSFYKDYLKIKNIIS